MAAAERRYALLVFDWDGTLIDSAGTIAECIQAASREMGLAVPDRQRARHVIGLGLHDSLRHAVPDLPRERYVEFAGMYRRHFLARESSMSLFEGVPRLLSELEQRGHMLAVATGKTRAGLDRALAASGLGVHFRASRCADETSPKPHPAMLLELMKELGTDPQRMLMVGDTSHDLEMARNAGVDAVAVTYGAHPEDALRAFEPLACASSVEDLARWLTRNG
jgi:phosphoglycolate phosphatase